MQLSCDGGHEAGRVFVELLMLSFPVFLSFPSVWPEQRLRGHHSRGPPCGARQHQLQHWSHQHHHGPAGGRGLRGGRGGRGRCPHQQQARGFVSSSGITAVLWGDACRGGGCRCCSSRGAVLSCWVTKVGSQKYRLEQTAIAKSWNVLRWEGPTNIIQSNL